MYGSATLEVMFFLKILGDSGPFQLFTVHLCKLQQWVNGHDLKATIAGVDEILGPIWTALDVQRENVVTEVKVKFLIIGVYHLKQKINYKKRFKNIIYHVHL